MNQDTRKTKLAEREVLPGLFVDGLAGPQGAAPIVSADPAALVHEGQEGQGASPVVQVASEVALPAKAAEGLATPTEGQEGITWGPLKRYPTTLGGVWKATKPVLRVVTMPWWWPVGYLVTTIKETPGRVKSAFLAPYKLMDASLRTDRARWEHWNQVERTSVVRQATVWFGLIIGTFAMAFTVPGAWKIVPLAALVALWGLRWQFDVVRAALRLPQVDEEGTPKAMIQGTGASEGPTA